MLGGMPEKSTSPTVAALKQMADEELAALKVMYAKREAAAKRYELATAALGEAEAAAKKARDEQQAAITDLLATGMSAGAVAGLLGVDERHVRPRPAKARGRGRGVAKTGPVRSEASEPLSVVA